MSRRSAEIAILVATSLLLLLFFANLNRPIWIDEFLQFAFASYRTPWAAAAAIQKSIGGLNFGQTGVYMLLDYFLIHIFGVSEFWLRFPSFVGGLLLFAGGIMMLRVRGFGLLWQIAVIFLLASENSVIFFVGDARPYMPLAGAVMAILAFYSANNKRRSGFVVWLGWFGAIYGAIMHPYFGPYMAMIAVVTFIDRWLKNTLSKQTFIASIIDHIDLRLTFAAIAAFTASGMMSWMRYGPILTYDPFEMIKADQLPYVFMVSHLQFLFRGDNHYYLDLMFLLVVCLFLNTACWPRFVGLIAPTLLLLASLGISILLSYSSYRNHYWILQRQWIASIALCIVATTWYFAELSRAVALIKFRPAEDIASILMMTASIVSLYPAINKQAERIDGWAAEKEAINRTMVDVPVARRTDMASIPTDLLAWVKLGTQNFSDGGRPWPIFRAYYGD